MTLNIETLTEEQRKQLDLGYNIYLNDKNKLVTEEPSKPYSSEFIEYKTEIINNRFENSINSLTSKYSQHEINSWGSQFKEATRISEGIEGDYPLVTGILDALNEGKENEDITTPVEYANLIITKANAFETATGIALGIKKRKLKDLEIN